MVFSDQTLGNFTAADPETLRRHHRQLRPLGRHRHPLQGAHDHLRRPRLRRHRAHEAAATSSRHRAAELGVDLRFGCEVATTDLTALGLGDADLVVAADGVNSAVRRTARRASSSPTSTRARPGSSGSAPRGGSTPSRSSSSRTQHGVFQAHAYRFDETRSAFIVECDEASWRNRRLRPHGHRRRRSPPARRCSRPGSTGIRCSSNMPPHQRAASLAQLRPRALRALVAREPRADRRRRAHRPLLHRLRHQARDGGRHRARARAQRAGAATWRSRSRAYEAERRTEALRLQNAARNSMEWFENVRRYAHLDARAVRLQPAHPQPARQPREPPPARPAAISKGRALVRGQPRQRGKSAQAAAADVHAVHACAG